MTRQKKIAIGFGVAALLAALTFAAVASAKDDGEGGDDDGGDCPDGMMPNPMRNPALNMPSPIRGMPWAAYAMTLPKCVAKSCAPGYHRNPATGACVKDTPDDPSPGFDPWDPGDNVCGEGMVRNALILKVLAQMPAGPERDAEIAKYPKCVPAECPDGYHRDEYGNCIANPSDGPKCPEGMRWDALRRECVPRCGPNEIYHSASGTCLPKPDAPTDDVDDIVKPVPVGGNFYQVRKGDIFLGTKISSGGAGKGLSICYMALRRAAFDSCVLVGGMSSDEAWAYVNSHASIIGHEIKSLRPYLDILTCSWWNDECYATWKFTYGKASAGPQGRALPLNPQNAPNLARLRVHDQPARNITLGKPSDKPSKNKPGSAAYGFDNSWRSYPLLWISEIDLEKFFNSGFNEITAQGLEWDDGSPRSVPPPWVQALGVLDVTGTLVQGTMMGCLGSSREVS